MSRAGPAIVPSEKCVRVSAPFSLAARAQREGEITGDVSSSLLGGMRHSSRQKRVGRTRRARVTRFHHRRRRLTDVDLERINQIVVRPPSLPPSLVTPRHSRVTPAMPGTRLPLTAEAASGRQAALY